MASIGDWKGLRSMLEAQGWTLEKRTTGHMKATPPDRTKSIVHFAQSNEPRAFRNTLADLKKQGFVWEESPVSRKSAESSAARTERMIAGGWDGEAVPVFDAPPFYEENDTEIAPALLPPTPPVSAVSEKAPDLDRYYADLKDAKAYAALAAEHLRETEAALEAAHAAHAQARSERDEATRKLKAAKATFDDAFSEEDADDETEARVA